jgi:beta-galactosidase
MSSRRRFLSLAMSAPLGGAALAAPAASVGGRAGSPAEEGVSLNGKWLFRLDERDAGVTAGWQTEQGVAAGWREVSVPHTWQVEDGHTEYYGVAWYRRTIVPRPEWVGRAVRVEFEAVFHSATVWLNGVELGEHKGKGYTAFTMDLRKALRTGEPNTLVVRVDNSFADDMLPRGRSSDWAHDGGIYRPVRLLVTPETYLERVDIDADPDLTQGEAALQVIAVVRNTSAQQWEGRVECTVIDETTGNPGGISGPLLATVRLAPGERREVAVSSAVMQKPKLWHFDHPQLYHLEAKLSNGHSYGSTFGVRKIEVRDARFYLNGEPVRLMGVERMAGSNPEFGMAEPEEWLDHDSEDMLHLNCVYTRVHWQQDRRLLDWCDRNGMMIQVEVPTWGGGTFKGMTSEPSAQIMNNGLEQLREMIERDRNHPSIFSWGMCNEIGGQNPPAYAFAKRMYEEAKTLDPKRLATYASNSLQKTPEKDAVGLMDYIMWNEYYESWYGGDLKALERNLDELHRAFPGKPIVISEYGYCACTPDRVEGDGRRMQVLQEHNEVFRKRDYVGGLIFFDYNDYRTHIGDKGVGALKQRVHGVVDLYGARKPSYELLRQESSPVESVVVRGRPGALKVVVTTRRTVPSYTLEGYRLRAIAYGFGAIPVERKLSALEKLPPGATAEVTLEFKETGIQRIALDIMRPTGYSAYTATWLP